MFSIEMDNDQVEIVVVDDEQRMQDLQLIVMGSKVFIRQYNIDTDKCDVIEVSIEMFAQLGDALESESQGVYGKRIVH